MFIAGSEENFIISDFIDNSGSMSKQTIRNHYQIPVGAKVKVEFKFQDGQYQEGVLFIQEVAVYNSQEKGYWDYHDKLGTGEGPEYLAGTFTMQVGNEYKTFSPETLEFISKGWIYVLGATSEVGKDNWWVFPPKVNVGYLKVSYSIQ